MTVARFPTVVILATALVAGCTAGPDYRPPVTPSAMAANGSFVTPVGELATTAPPPGDWWRLYADADVDRLVRQALAANTDLRQAIARLARARAVLSEARDQTLPRTLVSGGVRYRRGTITGPGDAGFSGSGFGSGNVGGNGDGDDGGNSDNASRSDRQRRNGSFSWRGGLRICRGRRCLRRVDRTGCNEGRSETRFAQSRGGFLSCARRSDGDASCRRSADRIGTNGSRARRRRCSGFDCRLVGDLSRRNRDRYGFPP